MFISALIQFSNLDIMGLHDIMFHSNMKIFEVNITFLYCDAFNIETLCKAVAWRERARARPETIFSGSSSRDISLHKRVGGNTVSAKLILASVTRQEACCVMVCK